MHEETYTIQGKKYRYQVTNYRVGTKIKHRRKYIGPVNPVYGKQRKKGGGRKASVYARAITDEERAKLETAQRSNNAFARDRAKIILLSSQRKNSKTICTETRREIRSVLEAIHSFNAKGVACLEQAKRSGRKPVFSQEQRARIVEAVNTDPRKLGKNFSLWSLPKLKEHAISTGIVANISIEGMRRILLKGNKKYKKSRRWLYSNDPDFFKKSS